ncbi:hypothetical protein L3X38_032013 [Prunus dulcis]|uniref:Uncharacterized protein n=1 Tax=Prunus dulcis TaxID=3755 RepID=A0AAD4YVI5_PRUDU|nr:hypothetical protein L3X38_032013 [Prunus dulcis]
MIARRIYVRRAKSHKSAETTRAFFFPISGLLLRHLISLRRRLRPLSPFVPQPPPCRHLRYHPAVAAPLPRRRPPASVYPEFSPPISLSSGRHFGHLRYDFSTTFCALADVGLWVPEQSPEQSPVCHGRMSDLIRRGRSMTTAPSSDPPAQSASAATAPAMLDHVVVGPGASQAPASSSSSVAQPPSARRRHRPTDTIDTTSTDGTGASGSQPGITTLLYC